MFKTFKSLTLTTIAIAALAAPAFAAGGMQLQNGIQIDTSIVNLTRIALPAAIQGKGCTFYEHANGGGESWHKSVGWLAQKYSSQDSYAEYVTHTGDWWNDRISSMQCDESEQVHCSVAVYPDVNKGGREAIFWGSQGLFNLADWGYDDTISSYMIFCNLMK